MRIVHGVFNDDLDPGRDSQWCDNALDQPREFRWILHDLVLSREMEQAADNVFAAIGLFDNHLNVFERLVFFGAFIAQQVGVHQYDAQRIVDFVSDAGRQLPHARQFLGVQEGLLGTGQFLVRFLQFAIGLAESVDGMGQAHFVFGQPPVNGDRVFAACFVAACTAIQFILGRRFSQSGQDLVQLFFVRLRNSLVLGTECAVQR